MIEAIHRFVAELRKAGVRVSPAEVIDAARAAQAMGIESRAGFRLALRTTLAKTRHDTEAFERVFTRVFAAPESPQHPGRRGKGEAPSAGGEGRRTRPLPPDEGKTPGEGAGRKPLPETESRRRLRPGRLKFILHSGGQRPLAEPRRVLPPRNAKTMTAQRARIPRREPSHPGTRVAEPRRLDLKGPLSSAREKLLAREIPRLIQEIRLKVGRRRRPGRHGRLWTARLMRTSAMTEGVPFVIPMRERRPRRPRLIVLADVSWSVVRASSFFLQMASAFVLSPHSRCRVSVYLFVDSCVEATGRFKRMKGDEIMPLAELIETLPLLNPKAPSDYGRAFHQAAHSRQASHAALRSGGRDTVLVVLGDARNNFGDPQAWAFEDLASRCRRVIWLVPEPVSLWDTGDSVLAEYLPSCDVVCEAGDLEGIAAGVAAMVRSF